MGSPSSACRTAAKGAETGSTSAAGAEEYSMAVQQNRKSRSKRDMRRSHHALDGPTLSIDPSTGETHRRHQVTADGYYRGRKVVPAKDE